MNSALMVFSPPDFFPLFERVSSFLLSSKTAPQKICLIFDEQHLSGGISGLALFMDGERCINSSIMDWYITREGTCLIACRIDSGVSYRSLARSI